MKKVQISHSSADKYTTCGYLYKLHYIDKIRPESAGSALFFGSAMDSALNRILLGKKKLLSSEEHGMMEKTPEEHFLSEFRTFKHNGKDIDISTSEFAAYYKSDLDTSVLEDDDYAKLKEFDPEIEDHEAYIEEIRGFIKDKQKLEEADQRLYNYICWLSLRKKGLMLIEAYRQDIYSQIHTTFSIQQKVYLPNKNGDFIIGYIDAVVSFNDFPERKVVLDNKTSSTTYKADSVSLSSQLATYTEFLGEEYAGYAVVEKKLRKREPRTRTQLIVDKVAESTYDETFDKYKRVLNGIKNEEFEKNYDSGCFFYGSKCPYYRYCRSEGKIMDGLVCTKKGKK